MQNGNKQMKSKNDTASGAYHLRDLCGGGDNEPNNTLKRSNAVS